MPSALLTAATTASGSATRTGAAAGCFSCPAPANQADKYGRQAARARGNQASTAMFLDAASELTYVARGLTPFFSLVSEIFAKPFCAPDQLAQFVVFSHCNVLCEQPFRDSVLIVPNHFMVFHGFYHEQLAASTFVQLWTAVVNMRAVTDLNPAPVLCMYGCPLSVLDNDGVVGLVVLGQLDTTEPLASVAVFESAMVLVYHEILRVGGIAHTECASVALRVL